MPLVSVLVPTHDHAETLPIAVASVQGQSVEDIAIVIVGDGVGSATHGQLRYGPFDAAQPWWRDAIYPPMNSNAISLTGVIHTLDSYRRLPYGWRPTPPGIATDHFMRRQYFALPGFRGATSHRATTVKLAAADRELLSGSLRAEELQRWWVKVQDPEFRTQWDAQVSAVLRRNRWRAKAVASTARAASLLPHRIRSRIDRQC